VKLFFINNKVNLYFDFGVNKS